MWVAPATIRRSSRPVFGPLVLVLFWSIIDPVVAEPRFDRIAREMQQLVDAGELPSIAVAIAKDGRIVWEAAFGWADRDGRVPASPHTPYSLASISKPFTATAVMKLVEAGRLSLDRPANDYLGDAPITGRRPERATVRRVLAHTAGLPSYFRLRSAGDGMSSALGRGPRAALVHTPGQRYVYSNLGYGLLDQIIERVSELGYAEFMRKEVFEPLRLEHTFVPAVAPQDAAVRYDPSGRPLPFYDVDHRGASSVYASAHDLVRFGMFHLGDGTIDGPAGRDGTRLLDARSLREMQRVHETVARGRGYGLGWRIEQDDRGRRHIGHAGGMPGVTTVLSLFPAERVVVVALANKRSEEVVSLAGRVAGAMVRCRRRSSRASRAV